MSKKSETPQGPLKYNGGDLGLFIVGVPARDLSAEEAKQYWPLIKATQDDSGPHLYTAISAESQDEVTAIQPDSK